MCYVTNRYSDTVSIIDTKVQKVVATVATSYEPQGVAVHPTTNMVYICNSDSNTISLINPTSTKSSLIEVGSNPQQIAFSPDLAYAYINLSTGIAALDLASNRVVFTIPKIVEDFAFTPNGSFLYATDMKNNKLYAMDTFTYEVKATIPLDPGPSNIAIGSDGKYAYITHFYVDTSEGSYPDYSDTVSVVDISKNKLVNKIRVGTCPLGIDILPNNQFAYVANYRSDTVSVIDLTTQTTIQSILVHLGPSAIAISPDGLYAYVTNTNSHNVSVIDTLSNSVVSTIAVGSDPEGVTLMRPLSS